MGFVEAVKKGLNNFFNPSGRASRSEYWWYWLFGLIIAGVLGVIGGFVSGNGGREQTWVGIIFDIFSFLMSVSIICASIRRLHDIGKSGWNVLWNLIPFFGSIYLLILMIRPSEPEPNSYGLPPVS